MRLEHLLSGAECRPFSDAVRLLSRSMVRPVLVLFPVFCDSIHAGSSGVPDAGDPSGFGPTAVRFRGIRLEDASPKDL